MQNCDGSDLLDLLLCFEDVVIDGVTEDDLPEFGRVHGYSALRRLDSAPRRQAVDLGMRQQSRYWQKVGRKIDKDELTTRRGIVSPRKYRRRARPFGDHERLAVKGVRNRSHSGLCSSSNGLPRARSTTITYCQFRRVGNCWNPF